MATRKRTVMVVDDSEIVLEVATASLEAAGYRVLTRSRPVGCVAMMLQEEPDLVLVDVTMPGVGGDTLVRCFGTAHPTSQSIVLLHSSLPEEVLQIKVRASGAHGYLRKTDNQVAFVREVDQWLRRAAIHGRSLAAPNSVPAVSGERMSAQSVVSSPAPPSFDYAAQRSGTHPKRASVVLLVDPDMLSLSQYRRDLQEDGLAFEFALSGGHAQRVLAGNNPPDVVVCNVELGTPSGLSVFESAVAVDPAWRHRFIFIAARDATEQLDRFRVHFPGPLLFQPVPLEELRRAIRSCLWRVDGGGSAAAC
jgi:CheY-like chemotaxis protein